MMSTSSSLSSGSCVILALDLSFKMLQDVGGNNIFYRNCSINKCLGISVLWPYPCRAVRGPLGLVPSLWIFWSLGHATDLCQAPEVRHCPRCLSAVNGVHLPITLQGRPWVILCWLWPNLEHHVCEMYKGFRALVSQCKTRKTCHSNSCWGIPSWIWNSSEIFYIFHLHFGRRQTIYYLILKSHISTWIRCSVNYLLLMLDLN